MVKRSKQRAERISKRNQIMKWGLTALTAILMVGSTVAFIFLFYSPQGQTQQYNGVSFSVDQKLGLYTFMYNGQKNYAASLPPDVASIDVPQAFITDLDNTSRVTIARSSAPDQYLAVATYYLADSLTKTGNFAVTQALTDGSSTVNCSDASAQNPIILFDSNNVSGLNYTNHCLTLDYADQNDILRYKDAVLYRVLGING